MCLGMDEGGAWDSTEHAQMMQDTFRIGIPLMVLHISSIWEFREKILYNGWKDPAIVLMMLILH